MSAARGLSSALMALAVSACGSSSFNEESADRVPAYVITNSLKCDLAQYFAYERLNKGLPFIIENGDAILASLTLNVVSARQFTVSGESSPTVLVFSGGSAGLGLSASVKRTITTVRKVEVKFTPTAEDAWICEGKAAELLVGGVGLYPWLRGVREDMAKARRGAPLVLVDKLTYSTEFGVERTAKGSATFTFVALKAGGEASMTRSDIQKIEVTVTTRKAPVPVPRITSPRSPRPSAGKPPSAPVPVQKPVVPGPKCDPTQYTCPYSQPGVVL